MSWLYGTKRGPKGGEIGDKPKKCKKCGHWLDGVDSVQMTHADGSVGCNHCAKDEDY